MPTTNFPKGATATPLPLPPTNVDLPTASEETLRSIGLLHEGATPEHKAFLARILSTPTKFIEPEFQLTDRQHGPRQKTNNATSPNWSGAIAFAPPGSTFTSASGQWNVSSAAPESFDG